MKKSYLILCLIALCIVQWGCHKPLVGQVLTPTPTLNSDNFSSTPTLDSIHSQSWRWFYGKYSTTYKDNNRQLSFKTSLKCSKDSALNALISLASIPVFNALATQDSLLYVNKKDRCYGRKSIESLSQLLGVSLSLRNIEELFLGLPIGYNPMYLDSSWLSPKKDTVYAQLISKNAREINYLYSLNPKNQRINWQKVYSPNDLTEATITYLDWLEINNMFIPIQINIFIQTPEQNLSVLFSYDKMDLNMPQDIYLQIPQDYVPCN